MATYSIDAQPMFHMHACIISTNILLVIGLIKTFSTQVMQQTENKLCTQDGETGLIYDHLTISCAFPAGTVA